MHRNNDVPSGPPLVRFQPLKYALEHDKGLSLTYQLSSVNRFVFGEGNEQAKILIVGEAPGWQEARSGRPFVGKSGQYVREMLQRCGVNPVQDAFITNSVRIRPPPEKYDHTDPRTGNTYKREKDTPPKALVMESHLEHLRRLVVEMQPDLVLCFGRISSTLFYNDLSFEKMMGCESRFVMPEDELVTIPIGKIHGKARPCFIEGMKRSVWAVPFYHPAYVMRNEKEPKMQWLLRKWQGDCQNALSDFREKPHMEASSWLRLSEREAGMDAESRAKGCRWANPGQEFFKRPDSESLATIKGRENYMYECNEIDYDRKKNAFHLFGRSDAGDSVCNTVSGFQFHFYTNLPERLRRVADKILQLQSFSYYIHPRDQNNLKVRRIANHVAIKLELAEETLDAMLHRFSEDMGEYLRKESYMDESEIKKVRIEVVRRRDMRKMRNRFEPDDMFLRVWVNRHTNVKTLLKSIRAHTDEDKLRHYETDIQAVERLTYDLKLRMSSWVEMPSDAMTRLDVRGDVPVGNQRTMMSTCDVEFSTHVSSLVTHDPTDPNEPRWARHAPQRIGAFDMECLGKNGKFPRPNNSPMIDMSFEIQNQTKDTVTDPKTGICADNIHYTFTLRACSPIAGTHLHMFKDEQQMIVAVLNFLEQVDFDQIWGHNVKRFDLYYLVKRMEYLRMGRVDGLKHMGRIRGEISEVVERKFQSRAYGERIQVNVPMAGRAIIDSLDVYMREKKLGCYMLSYLAEKYLGDTKNDMPYVAIPGFFWGSADDNCKLNEYCKKDAKLVIQLMNIHKWLFSIWEFARINGTVSANGIYERGQQIKVFSGMKHTINQVRPNFIIHTKDRPVVFYDGEQHEVAEKEYVEETFMTQGSRDVAADALGFNDRNDNDTEEESDDNDDSDDDNDDNDNDDDDDDEERAIWSERDEQKRSEKFRKLGERRLERMRGMIDDIRERKNTGNARALPDPAKVGARRGVQTSLASFFTKAGVDADAAEKQSKRVSKLVFADPDKEVLSCSERSKYKWAHTVGDVRRRVEERVQRLLKSKEEQAKRVLIKGASVFEAWVGLHIVPVLCADFESLYPSMMIRYNQSFETKVFANELRSRFLTLDDVYLSPIKGVPTHLKEHEFRDDQERADAMEDMYFVKQEWLRTVFASDMERLGFTADDVTDTGTARVHPFKQHLKELMEDGTLYETLDAADTAGYAVSPDELLELQPETIYLLNDEKEGMGILPLTLVCFLSSRKVAKTAKANSVFGSTMFYIFDGRQLSLKILANSTFGATSVEEGKLSDPDIGGSVTAFGRYSIELARDKAYEKWGKPDTVFTRGEDVRETKCVGGDSVTADTPILVRSTATQQIRLKSIESLVENQEDWNVYGEEKEHAMCPEWEVWTHRGWAPIRRVIRHDTCKQIYRVCTRSGCVDVTEDHSLIRDDETIVTPGELVTRITQLPTNIASPRTSSPGDRDIALLHSYPNLDDLPDTAAAAAAAATSSPEDLVNVYLLGKRFVEIMQFANHRALEYAIPDSIVYGHRSLRHAFVKGISRSGFLCRDLSHDRELEAFDTQRQIKQEDSERQTLLQTCQEPIIATSRRDEFWRQGFKFYTLCKNLAAQVYFILRSLDFEVMLTSVGPCMREYHRKGGMVIQFWPRNVTVTIPEDNMIQSICSINDLGERKTVYDLEVDAELVNGGGVFQAGVGSMIVHNTDSFFMAFCFVHTIDQGMEFGFRLVNFLNKFFVLPMRLAFEKVMMPLLIYAKKRYTGNLFSGEDNGDFFEKKRWMELHVPQEQWEAVFTMRRYPRQFESVEAMEQWDAANPKQRVLSHSMDGLVVNAMLDGPLHWWRNGVYKSKAEWYGLLTVESDRRNAQNDEEWMEDYRRPRYYGKEYAPAEYGRLFSKGIETVRRDALPLVKRTLGSFLNKALIQGRVLDGLEDMHLAGKKLLNGDVNALDLICSKKISKEVYKKRNQPHTHVQHKILTDPDSYYGIPAPELGDRVPFFVTVGGKNDKTFSRAEHPIRVIRENIPIDFRYYMVNKFIKPCLRTVRLFMDAPDKVLFDLVAMSNKRWNTKFNPSTNTLASGVARVIQCVLCRSTGTTLKPNARAVCSTCMTLDDAQLREGVLRQEEAAKKADDAYEHKLDTVCRPCTNTRSAPCTWVMCPHWIPRIKLERDAADAHKLYESTCRVAAERLPDIEDLVMQMDARSLEKEAAMTKIGVKRLRQEDTSASRSGSDWSSSSSSSSSGSDWSSNSSRSGSESDREYGSSRSRSSCKRRKHVAVEEEEELLVYGFRNDDV